MISYQAPTEESEDEEKDLVNSQLELPSYDTNLLLDDTNAKIDEENVWKCVAGRHNWCEITKLCYLIEYFPCKYQIPAKTNT